MKPKTLVLPPASRLEAVCSEACRDLLNEHFDPVWNDLGRDYTEAELLDLISEAEVVLTSWGSPNLTEEMIGRAPKLRAVGHAAGTVKTRVPRSAFGRGIRVYSAAPRIAQSVGEYVLACMLTLLRRLPQFHDMMRAGKWKTEGGMKGHELAGNTVGIVSASSTARELLKLLVPFHVKVLLYDPYLSEEKARELHVVRATLEQVMRCPIISVHAPSLPSTQGMITKELLALIPDGAIFINSSRATVLDEQALLAELKTGRFMAALDVFAQEPLPADSPFRQLDNVLLTPHVAGASVQGHLALMQAVVEDILRGMRGEPTKYEVYERMWETMA